MEEEREFVRQILLEKQRQEWKYKAEQHQLNKELEKNTKINLERYLEITKLKADLVHAKANSTTATAEEKAAAKKAAEL